MDEALPEVEEPTSLSHRALTVLLVPTDHPTPCPAVEWTDRLQVVRHVPHVQRLDGHDE